MSLSGSSSTSPLSGSSSTSAEPRRLRIVRIADFVLGAMFNGRPDQYVTSDWPGDARVVDAGMAFDRQELHLVVWSSTFDEVPEGAAIPHWEPMLTAHLSDLGEVADAMRRERIEMTLDEGLRP